MKLHLTCLFVVLTLQSPAQYYLAFQSSLAASYSKVTWEIYETKEEFNFAGPVILFSNGINFSSLNSGSLNLSFRATFFTSPCISKSIDNSRFYKFRFELPLSVNLKIGNRFSLNPGINPIFHFKDSYFSQNLDYEFFAEANYRFDKFILGAGISSFEAYDNVIPYTSNYEYYVNKGFRYPEYYLKFSWFLSKMEEVEGNYIQRRDETHSEHNGIRIEAGMFSEFPIISFVYEFHQEKKWQYETGFKFMAMDNFLFGALSEEFKRRIYKNDWIHLKAGIEVGFAGLVDESGFVLPYGFPFLQTEFDKWYVKGGGSLILGLGNVMLGYKF